ncbi:divergent CRAL/TRIO domain-containing protein [Macrophomina phaseolina]|uniref:Divergent CRAL/TRIO domain-containing protein n=1 Tax=Macrophomina phaseolina TaxID=35725 RepID=A0ABQ8FW42_9PEZI|nr:divergent CRAL/TRIO domain-containing protein [Macrophomina phaseolina]
MRAQLAQRAGRLRSTSLSAVPPPRTSADYDHELAKAAASILYRTPVPSDSGLPIYILNAAALPDADEHDFDALLPYVLARLPGEEELLSGTEYEVIFFAGGDAERAAGGKRNRPGWGWFIQAYHVLSRAMRKRLQKLYIVHERSWVRILVEMFSTIVSPKFRRKIVHVSTLTQLALHMPIQTLLIPPSAYLHDRRLSPDIYAPFASGRRAFSVKHPLPQNAEGDTRLPRVLRETTTFLLMDPNIRTEGIFRIPPHSRLKEILKEAYDRGQKYILWKENGVMLPLPPFDQSDSTKAIVEEVDSRDCYGVYLSAGLIKTWYAELRQPIFPQSSYREVRSLFGNPDEPPTRKALMELISPKSEWSAIPVMSREILVRHLLPLLSVVAAHQDDNKMTAENLAVCFAPTLVCGPDQIEDAKMSSVVRRILAEAIDMWDEGLREDCGINETSFQRDLRSPQTPHEYEDPLEAAPKRRPDSEDFGIESPSEEDAGFADSEKQFSGIILQDNSKEETPPALPPRPSVSSSREMPLSPTGSDDSSVRRKPAPSVQVPPRYSAVLADEMGGSSAGTQSPLTYAATTDGFAPARSTGWNVDEKKQDKSSARLPGPTVPHIIVPKRKALTAEQIASAESTVSSPERAMIGAAAAAGAVHRKPISSRPGSSGSSKPSTPPIQSPNLTSPSTFSTHNAPGSEYTRERSRSRGPTINSLARPVYPAANSPSTTNSANLQRAATMASEPPTKPRAMSSGLLKRMPSFEPPPIPKDNPRKLDLKKKSVEDLRRLFEERAGAAEKLVKLGNEKMKVEGKKG